MIFQQIRMAAPQSDDEQDRAAELIDDLTNADHGDLKKQKDLLSLEQPLRLLEAHGITMIPVDNDASIVENAMESGRTLVVTGKIGNSA